MTFSILQLRFSISMAGIILGIVERHGLSKYYNLSQFSFYFSEYFSDCFFFFDFKKLRSLPRQFVCYLTLDVLTLLFCL